MSFLRRPLLSLAVSAILAGAFPATAGASPSPAQHHAKNLTAEPLGRPNGGGTCCGQ